MMEQMRASLMRVFQTVLPNVQILDGRIPKQIPHPSAYFPEPYVQTTGWSKDNYITTYNMTVVIFNDETGQSVADCNKFLARLVQDKHFIELYNIDGTPSGKYIELDEPNSDVIGTGEAKIFISWKVPTTYSNKY